MGGTHPTLSEVRGLLGKKKKSGGKEGGGKFVKAFIARRTAIKPNPNKEREGPEGRESPPRAQI